MQNTSWASNPPSPERSLPWLARLGGVARGIRLAAHVLFGALTVLLVFPLVTDRQRRRLKQRWAARILRTLDVRIDGQLAFAPAGSLFVANHISWLDIHVLNAIRPMAFVAKSEVRCWPVFGWLAARAETVFLRRASSKDALAVNSALGALLGAKVDVAIFPEGTTSDGQRLLDFHSALFQAAVDAQCRVQPLSLVYVAESGQRSQVPVYAGDTTLLQSLWRVLSNPGLTVKVRATPPLDAADANRRQLVRSAHAAIAFSLGLTGQGALPARA